MMSKCFFIKEPKPKPVCVVQLGRFGDVMIVLPAMKHFYEVTGVKPVMVIAREFSGVLDGVSYVEPWPVDLPWTSGVLTAKQYAEASGLFERVIVPKWWDCPGQEPPPPMPNEQPVYLTHQGRKIVVTSSEWDSYMLSQWKPLGFNRRQLAEWPLEFDRRSPAREASLCAEHLHPRKPTILLNFSGISNPMPAEPEVIRVLAPLDDKIHMLNLRHVTAERIYDLLGLYDKALCVISGDTATLHLAAASRVPLIALVANGGAGSLVKGNCVLKLRYKDVGQQINAIRKTVDNLLNPIPIQPITSRATETATVRL